MLFRVLIPLLAVAAVAIVPFAAPSLQLLVNLALAKGLAVVGVTVLLRAGQVSFGHALYFAIAAYDNVMRNISRSKQSIDIINIVNDRMT